MFQENVQAGEKILRLLDSVSRMEWNVWSPTKQER